MSEETKDLAPQTEAKATEPVVDQEALTNSIIDKVKAIFKKEEKPDTKDAEPTVNIDEIVAQKVKEHVDKLAAKEKEKVRKTLEEEKAELEVEKKKIAIEKQFISLNIDPKFQDYIRHEIESKDVALEDFIKDNPQFIHNAQPQQVSTNIRQSGLDTKGAEYLAWRKSQTK